MHSRNARRSVLCLLLASFMLVLPAAMGTLHAASPAGDPVDINRAGVQEFETLPGVGPALARRIVEFREKNGPFRSVDELLKIRGIGEKSLEKLRGLVTVGGKKKKS